MVRELLGPKWSLVSGFAVAFVLYTLVYAYVSGGGSIIEQSITSITGTAPPRLLNSLVFALLLTVFIWWSSEAVDKFSILLVAEWSYLTFISLSGLITQLRVCTLQARDRRAWGTGNSGGTLPLHRFNKCH